MESSQRIMVQEGSLASRLVTYPLLDQNPAAFRVTRIHWDSGFRGSGLQVGDEIVAVNGVAIERPEKLEDQQRMLSNSVGQLTENQYWEKQGAREDDPIRLTVRRRTVPGQGWELMEIEGVLRNERRYINDEQRWTLGPGGPADTAYDGFSESWASWYEKLTAQLSLTMANAWQHSSFSSRYELDCHLESQGRVEYLAQHYPGPLADALTADWQVARISLTGRKYELSPDALEFRRLEDERVREVSSRSHEAWDTFLETRKPETIAPFPGVDPIHGDLASQVGKYVLLPSIGNRDWISEAGHNWLVSGQDQTYYFIDTENPAAERMLFATRRYRRIVAPNISEEYVILGRILPEPRLLVIRESGTFGIQIEAVAALVGDSMFVDLTVEEDGRSPFAGEAALMKPSAAMPPDDATPRQVMEAWIAALKEGDVTLWKEFFTDWNITALPDGRPAIHAYEAWVSTNDWEDSRRRLLDDVYGIEVVWVGEPRDVMTGHEFERAPHIEEVAVEIDHIGSFAGEYRAFSKPSFHRWWKLQRFDGGPWRISTVQGI